MCGSGLSLSICVMSMSEDSRAGTGDQSVPLGRVQGVERVETGGPFCVPGKLYTPSVEAPVQVRSSGTPSGRGLRPGGRGKVLETQAGRCRCVWDADGGDRSWCNWGVKGTVALRGTRTIREPTEAAIQTSQYWATPCTPPPFPSCSQSPSHGRSTLGNHTGTVEWGRVQCGTSQV